MVAARSALVWRAELLADLGGEDSISAQRAALVESAVRTRLYLDHLDCWLMEQTSLVNGRRKAALPILRDRQVIADSLSRLLQQLGLERLAPKAKTLADIAREITEDKARRQDERERQPEQEGPEGPAGAPELREVCAGAEPGDQAGQVRGPEGPVADVAVARAVRALGIAPGPATDVVTVAASRMSRALGCEVLQAEPAVVEPRSPMPATRREPEQTAGSLAPEIAAHEGRPCDRDRAGLADPTAAADREDRNEPLVAEPEEWF
jgi:hypothetical protein